MMYLIQSLWDQLGFTGCPSDAVNECKEKAKYICTNKGGDGAVREFVEKILLMLLIDINQKS